MAAATTSAPCSRRCIAGGGFKGGAVVGESDAQASEVKDRPVYPWDLIGSMYAQMGIDPDGNIQHPQGMEVAVAAEGQ